MHHERRIDQRIRHSLPAYIVRSGALEPVDLTEVSFRGLFLRTSSTQAVWELLKLRIDLPERELVTHAVVARVVKVERASVFGIGVRFFALTGRDKADWEAFVQTLVVVRRAA